MKGTLEFDLNEPTERDDFDLACNAQNLKFCVDEFRAQLRKWCKYNLPEGEEFTAELVRDKFYECFKDRDMERFLE